MEWGTGFFSLGVLSIMYGMYSIANGRLKNKVNKDACHSAMGGIEKQFKNLEKYIGERIEDLKDFIIQNGK